MTTSPTQHDAAATYEALQAKAAGESQELTRLRVHVAELRTEREVARELAQLSREADDDARHSMGAVAWLVLACVIAGIIGAWLVWLWAVAP